MRYWFLNIHIQCGEYEFNSKSVHKTDKEAFDAEEYAKEFYGRLDKNNNPDDTIYYFNGGEVAVCVYDIKEIKKNEYDILRKFN